MPREKEMKQLNPKSGAEALASRRSTEIFSEYQQGICKRTDQMFAVLMTLQWIAGIAAAYWISPLAWVGTTSKIHLHLWVALFLGSAISSPPVFLALTKPGRITTRYTIAVGQMLMGALLIHLSGGRIETHFHVFGSLAFLSFYRDWRVLVPATLIVAADHFLRGIFWPQSVYGILAGGQWRWIEHSGWVLFEDIFLFIAISRGVNEMWGIAERTAKIEALNQGLEGHIAERTHQLTAANENLMREVGERKRAERFMREATKRALAEYERLVERIAALGQTLEKARDLTMIFRALHDFAQVSAPCDGMVISLYDPDKQVRRSVYCWTDDKEFEPESLDDMPVKDGIAGRAIKTGSVVIENNYQQQMRAALNPITVGEFAKRQLPRSALSAPMTVMGRPVGCIELQSYQADAYHEEHVTAMRMAANLAATAVENVQLIEREQIKEEQLRQSQKMEAIGQLAGGVAHDFNNLLTVITGYSEMALRRIGEDNPLRKNIEEISKAGTRAAGLTRQLLAYSRRQMLQPKVLDLNTVVRDMNKMLRRLIGEDIDLVTVLKPALGQIKADPGQIEQVLLNLVVNARDAMPTGGKITIETRHAYLDEAYARKHVGVQCAHYVVLSVSDTGVGIDAETQKRIFDPFFTTKEIGKGTGLGLSTVYGIVKQSEGNIWVYSELGRGTTFKVYLPRVGKIIEGEELTDGSRAVPGGSETLLLVEDEDLVRKLSVEILEEFGYAVIAASNGEEGVRLCKEFDGRIQLLVTDVVMPQMSGRELAEQVALLRPETKVLYMSGYTDDAIVRHGILEDNVSFIQKPFSPDVLALKVREVLDRPIVQPA
jgi:signal transduction histidine kinase/CheY-like chemotaxis protein